LEYAFINSEEISRVAPDFEYFFDLVRGNRKSEQFAGVLCLDRDGVIIKEKNYLKDPDKIEFIRGSIKAMKDISAKNFFIAIISNQAGLAKGLISEKEFRRVNGRFIELLQENKVFAHCVIYCPYHPDGVVGKFVKESIYRKPRPGMYHYICKYYKLKSDNVYMVGDKITDIEFGKNIGAKCIMVGTGYGRREKKCVLGTHTDVVHCKYLSEAIVWIIQNNKIMF
jgi:D-glycero-D-manno-heptose 1,7-bisphosphate phosphatase